jgi:hypothetical protein
MPRRFSTAASSPCNKIGPASRIRIVVDPKSRVLATYAGAKVLTRWAHYRARVRGFFKTTLWDRKQLKRFSRRRNNGDGAQKLFGPCGDSIHFGRPRRDDCNRRASFVQNPGQSRCCERPPTRGHRQISGLFLHQQAAIAELGLRRESVRTADRSDQHRSLHPRLAAQPVEKPGDRVSIDNVSGGNECDKISRRLLHGPLRSRHIVDRSVRRHNANPGFCSPETRQGAAQLRSHCRAPGNANLPVGTALLGDNLDNRLQCRGVLLGGSNENAQLSRRVVVNWLIRQRQGRKQPAADLRVRHSDCNIEPKATSGRNEAAQWREIIPVALQPARALYPAAIAASRSPIRRPTAAAE